MSSYPMIPGYMIEKELGQGGMARVYLAHEHKLDRIVALKVLLPSYAQLQNAVERFTREASVLLHFPTMMYVETPKLSSL